MSALSGNPAPADTGARPALMLFDLDDTLVDHRGAVDRGLLTYRRELGGAIAAADDASEAARWTELETTHYGRYLAGDTDFEGQRRARAQDYLAVFGIELSDAEASEWFDTYFAHYRAAWSLHPDARGVLDRLVAAGIPLGIITNGEPDFQARKMAACGLGPEFAHVVASGALGITKPDPAIFTHAISLFDVAPGEAWYVGDRLRTDALGAAGAGLHGVWLDRPGAADAGQRAEAAEAGCRVIRGLDELLELLGV